MEEKQITKISLLDFDEADKKYIDLGKMIVTKIKKEVAIENRMKAISNMEGRHEN